MTIEVNNKELEVMVLDTECTTIFNSTQIKSWDEMKEFIIKIRKQVQDGNAAIHKRTITSQIMEWRSHNLLFKFVPKKFAILRFRLQHVDLEKDISPTLNIAYYILGCFYPHY